MLEGPGVFATCKTLEYNGINITRAPGPMKHGTDNITFIEDPDGHKIDLLESL